MSWRKRSRKLDLSGIDIQPPPQLPLEHMALASRPLPELACPERNLERDWKALGERAWKLLAKKRMNELFPGEAPSEFRRYHKLLKRSSPKYRDEIFIGLGNNAIGATEDAYIEDRLFRPIFVPRFVFQRHGYVLGGSGSGKTTHALAQILIQLAEGYTGTDGWHDPPPILIMDLKQNGDRYLRALAERLARIRNQRLRFFSNDSEYESLSFDPLHCFQSVRDPIKLMETLLKAFGLMYPEGYGSDFFTAEQRIQLLEVLHKAEGRRSTMDELITALDRATRGRGANTDARGLYSAMATLGKAQHVHTSGQPIDPERQIDFQRFFEQREVLYVHLDSRSLALLTRDIGKLMLFSLLETASQREKRGEKVQCYVVIDEFHRLAARNVVEMLEDARAAGVGFVLSHQSSSSLKTRDTDLYGILFENCSFKQCLTLEDPKVIELFREIAGRKSERRLGGSTSQSYGTSESRTQSHSHQSGFSHGGQEDRWLGGTSYQDPRWSEGNAVGESSGQHVHRGQSETKSWREEMVSALTPEMITRVNDTELLSLVHVKGVGTESLTPTGGIPTLIQGLFPFPKPQADEWYAEKWRLKPAPSQQLEFSAAAEQGTVARERPKGDARPTARPAVAGPTGRNEGETRELRKRIHAAADRLGDQMLPESLSVERFARAHGLRVKEVLRLAKLAGVHAEQKEDRLSPGQIAAVQRQIDQPRKR